MTSPLHIEFAGALYHVTSRGDRREAIFEDGEDRETFLRVCPEVAARYHWRCYACCLMPDHYHPLLETVEGRLSQGMRHLNGVYTQASNRRHRRTGHQFQGRFQGILVDKDAYLLEWSRYVVRNPVRAKFVETPEEWSWSSYRATVGTAAPPDWLAVDGLQSRFASVREEACRRYRAFVSEGIGQRIWEGLRQQISLGDEAFVQRMQSRAAPIATGRSPSILGCTWRRSGASCAE